LLKTAGHPDEILCEQSIRDIFGKIEVIIKVTTSLLEMLRDRFSDPSWSSDEGCLGDIFLQMVSI
jgi:hypothetical protein